MGFNCFLALTDQLAMLDPHQSGDGSQNTDRPSTRDEDSHTSLTRRGAIKAIGIAGAAGVGLPLASSKPGAAASATQTWETHDSWEYDALFSSGRVGTVQSTESLVIGKTSEDEDDEDGEIVHNLEVLSVSSSGITDPYDDGTLPNVRAHGLRVNGKDNANVRGSLAPTDDTAVNAGPIDPSPQTETPAGFEVALSLAETAIGALAPAASPHATALALVSGVATIAISDPEYDGYNVTFHIDGTEKTVSLDYDVLEVGVPTDSYDPGIVEIESYHLTNNSGERSNPRHPTGTEIKLRNDYGGP